MSGILMDGLEGNEPARRPRSIEAYGKIRTEMMPEDGASAQPGR